MLHTCWTECLDQRVHSLLKLEIYSLNFVNNIVEHKRLQVLKAINNSEILHYGWEDFLEMCVIFNVKFLGNNTCL